jgi:hypothetical protein
MGRASGHSDAGQQAMRSRARTVWPSGAAELHLAPIAACVHAAWKPATCHWALGAVVEGCKKSLSFLQAQGSILEPVPSWLEGVPSLPIKGQQERVAVAQDCLRQAVDKGRAAPGRRSEALVRLKSPRHKGRRSWARTVGD